MDTTPAVLLLELFDHTGLTEETFAVLILFLFGLRVLLPDVFV